MNKRYIFAALVAACTLTFTSCSNHENDLRTAEDQVNITASVASGVLTRADGVTDYTPANGTLTVLYGSMSADASQQAAYTYANNVWTANGTPLYWNDLTAVGTAYPFFAAAPAVPTASPAVAADQNAAGAYAASDQLLAYTAAARKEQVGFTFRHVLSQVSIAITSGNTTDADYIDPSTAIVSVKGVRTAYALNDAAPTADAPAVATATGDADATLTAFASETGSARKHFLVLPPQNLATGELSVTITLGSNSYTWKNTEALDLLPGKRNSINLMLKKSGMTLADIKLADWDNSPAPVNGNLAIIISGDKETATGSAPAFSSMKLWKGETDMTANTAPINATVYTKDASGTWSSTTPFYFDDTTTSDRFYALAQNTSTDGKTPITDTTTGLSDLVAAGPVQVKGGAIALSYRHLMAKLRITLSTGAGFAPTLVTTDASITTPAMKPDFTLNYAADGKAITTTATGTATAYTDLAAATDYIVVPQILPQGSKITVKLANGNIYTGTIDTALTLEAGKVHTVALTFNSAANISISIGVTDWSIGSSVNSSLTIDGITTADGTDTGTPDKFTPANDDQLTLTATSMMPALAATYIYEVNEWTSAAPLYWDSFMQGTQYDFFALLTPAAGTNADNGTVKDYLGGTITGVSFGSPLAFELSHRMTQVVVNLKAGSGFTEADLANATITLLSLKKLAGIAETDATISLGEDATPLDLSLKAPATAGKGYSASVLVAPQTLAAGSPVAHVTIDGKNYTYAAPAEGHTYQPGKVNHIMLSISKSGITATFSLTPWGIGNTTGGDIEIDK